MNNNQVEKQYNTDGVDLKDIFLALWKRKKTIIAITLLFALIAGISSKFIISPVFDTKLNIVIDMPESYLTRYGEYKLPITTNEQYISLIKSNDVLLNTIKDMGYQKEEVTIEDLQKRITLGGIDTKSPTKQNSFLVTVSADNPEESLKLATYLYDNYISFIDVMTKERALYYYKNNFNIELKSLAYKLEGAIEILNKNEELLSQTPININNGNASIEIQTQLNDMSNYSIPIENINPNYIKLESEIISNKQLINSIENSMKMYNQHLAEIDTERQSIGNYYKNGQTELIGSSIISLVETSVYLPSQPVAPINKTSPSNAVNTIIGALIGGMIGVFAALIKEYWI